MKKVKLIGIIAFCLIVIYFMFTGLMSKLTYTVGSERGYSLSLQESKQRGIFIRELNYQVIPDNLNINSDYVFYIEKGFSYGENSALDTDPLAKEEQQFPYQVIFGCIKPCKKYGGCDFDCDTKKYVRKDTMIILKKDNNTNFKKENFKKHKYLQLKERLLSSRDTLIYDIIVDNIKNYNVDTIGRIRVWTK